MANKGNAALAVDREAIGSFHTYAVALDNELDRVRADLLPAVTYLTADENLSGGDTEDFKDNVQVINKAFVDVKAKINTIAVTVGKMASILGDNASRKNATIKDAKNEMGAALMKLKQTGK